MAIIHVENWGPLLLRTDYWNSELARNGKLYCSVNAGAIRILLPPTLYSWLAEMRSGKSWVLSRGPWPAERRQEAIEIMFDDGSDSPFSLHLTPESFDRLPGEPEPGREWVLSVWTAEGGKPHKELEQTCHWRRVDKLPWLQPWE